MTKQELILANVVQKRAIANVVMEMLNQRSFGLEGADLSELYDRAAEIQFYFENESYKADPDLKELRKASMKLDHILSEFLPKGKVEIGEAVLVPIGTVDGDVSEGEPQEPEEPNRVKVYYGWADSAEYPSESAILTSDNSLLVSPGASITVPFDEVQDWKHAWFATPDTEPLKTNWDGQNSPLNRGDIGGESLFGNPVHIGSFYYYFTTFATIFEMPVVITGGGTLPDVIEPGEVPETITPEPPTLTANDTLNTLTAAHALGNSEILVSINGAPYVQYTGVINVGDVDRPAGYWRFKIKSAEYRNESAVVNSPEFTKVPVVVPDQYTLTVQVNGVSNYTVYVNGAAIVGNTMTVNEGTVLSNITVIRAGYNISPSVVSSVTMDQDRTLVFEATEIPIVYPDRTLNVIINGLNDTYKILIDGVEQTGPLTFVHGTILDNISVEVEGFTITPADHDGIVMDQNRTVVFTATQITHTLTVDTGSITGVELYVDGVLHIGPLVFNHGTELVNLSVYKAGFSFTPTSIASVLMTQNRVVQFVGEAIPQRKLTVVVTGPEVYTLRINGIVRTGTEFEYNEGTVVPEVSVTAAGYTIDPVRRENILMDVDKTIEFVGTPIPQYTLNFSVDGPVGYTVKINGVVQPSGELTYYAGTVLTNITLEKTGWAFEPATVPSLLMNENKILVFAATEVIDGNYLPGFSPYEPDERYAREDQGGQASLVEVSPGVHKITVHRLDFISYIRVPIGGEVAIKEKDNESTILHFNPALPWPNDANKNDYYITGYSGGPTGKFGFYGNGHSNRMEIRYWSDNGFYVPTTIPSDAWIVYRRTSRHILDIFYTTGFDEVPLFQIDMTTVGPGGNDFMYLKHTIWDEDHINYPQQRGCFHELNDTWPPAVIENDVADTLEAVHSTLGPSEILVSENNGAWAQYTGPINIGNTDKPFGYWRFKVKAAQGRPESIAVKSPAFFAEPFTEGLTDLVFTDLENIAYNASTKAYSRVTSNAPGYGWDAKNFLPVDGSAAIYFNTSVENIWVGFFEENKSMFRGDMQVSLTITSGSREFYYSYKGGPNISTLPPAVSGNDYRLVCRQVAGNRVWKIEGSADNWVTYTELYTFPIEANTQKLYPLMFIQDGVANTGNNFRYEVYAGQNVPEMNVVTPDPPTNGIVNNSLDTFDWTNSPGYSSTTDYQATTNGGSTWIDLTSKPFYVGNVNLGVGMVGVRVKSALGRNHSAALYNTQPFTEAVNTTPAPPTVTGNDTTNTLTASHALGNSEIVVSVNNGAYVAYSGPISVGDVNRAAGYWKFKIKSAAGRNESSVVNSPAFTKVPVNQVVLTVNVTGAASYTVMVNGSAIVGNTLSVDQGTVLQNVSVVAPGYSVDPVNVPSVTMDQSKSIEFVATEIPEINYLPDFVPVNLMPIYAGIISNSNGVWTRISGSQEALFMLQYPLEVGQEFALKVSPTSYSLIGTADEAYSLWIDSDSGISVNTGGYPNLLSGADAVGKFIIYQRDSLTSIKIFSSDGVSRTELYTFTTPSSPSITFGGKIDNSNGTVDYPQMFGVDAPVDPEEPGETGGKANLEFSALTNLVYDDVTNIYTKVNPAEAGYGHSSGRILEVDKSGAIYFCDDCRDMYIGFHTANSNVYRYDGVISIQLAEYNKEMVVRDGAITQYFRRDTDSHTEYRLVSRMVSGNRVWTLEGSQNNWVNFSVIYTYVNIQANTATLYPVLYVGTEANSLVDGLKCEINLTGNIL